jgi:DNA-directed RNA polymerase beta subunit
MQNNELKLQYVGIQGLNSYCMHNSSSRAVMFSSHIGQRLVIEGAQQKLVQTGLEQEFGKYTFNVKMPENGRIVAILDRYPRGVGSKSLNFNPETYVFFEREDNKQVDYILIPYKAQFHQNFGFKYKMNKKNIGKLQPGAYIAKDTIFADSPAVSDNGNFMFGINANIALMSIPSVAEDGIMISRDFLPKLKFKIYDTRQVNFGSKQFPLNLYGTLDEVKPFPEIGDKIREDGILMAFRDFNTALSPVEMSKMDLMEVDHTFDECVYVRGGVGTVVDIKITRNNSPIKNMPVEMSCYLNRYWEANQAFYKKVIDLEAGLRKDNRMKFGTTDILTTSKFDKLVYEAMVHTNHNFNQFKQPLQLQSRKSTVDEYQIQFTIEYTIEPCEGFKLTDNHGFY